MVTYFLFFGSSGSGSLIDAFTLIFGESEYVDVMSIIVWALANLTLVIYDIALTKLITVYFIKIKPKFKKLGL